MASKKLTAEQQHLFDALTLLQKKFVTELLKGKNQTDAYKKAGGKAKGESAHVQASRMMSFDKVAAFMSSVEGKAIDDAIMTREEALKRLTSMARASITDLVEFAEHDMGVDDDGREVIQAAWRFKDSVKNAPELLNAIAELTAGKDGIKLKLHDARSAIKQLSLCIRRGNVEATTICCLRGLQVLTSVTQGGSMEFIERYPEFASTEPTRREIALQDAENQMSRKVWGKLFEQGHHALAAHLLYVSGALTPSGSSNGKPAQTITSRSVAGVSMGYSAPDAGFGANHDGYAISSYGQDYTRLRKLVGVHVLAIR